MAWNKSTLPCRIRNRVCGRAPGLEVARLAALLALSLSSWDPTFVGVLSDSDSQVPSPSNSLSISVKNVLFHRRKGSGAVRRARLLTLNFEYTDLNPLSEKFFVEANPNGE